MNMKLDCFLPYLLSCPLQSLKLACSNMFSFKLDRIQILMFNYNFMFTLNHLKELAKEIDMLREKIEKVDPQQDLASQGIDSLDILSLLLLIQEKYNIQIPDEDIPKLSSLNEIVEYVNKKLQEIEN